MDNGGEQPSDPAWADLVRKAVPVVYRGAVEQGKVQEIPCDSWSEFHEKVRFSDSPFARRMFRGQSETVWRLQSKWDRYDAQKRSIPDTEIATRGRRDTPETFLQRFRSSFIGTPGIDTSSLDPDAWMALARHHGLITRLLDWTESPYVAAFFAFRDLLPVDRDLGCLNPGGVLANAAGSVAVWQLPRDGVIEKFEALRWLSPRNAFVARQRAQSGHFTLLESLEHHSLEEYLDSKNYLHLLRCYHVPKRDAIQAMHDLWLMNISEATMFPDADGAARAANQGQYLEWMSLLDQVR